MRAACDIPVGREDALHGLVGLEKVLGVAIRQPQRPARRLQAPPSLAPPARLDGSVASRRFGDEVTVAPTVSHRVVEPLAHLDVGWGDLQLQQVLPRGLGHHLVPHIIVARRLLRLLREVELHLRGGLEGELHIRLGGHGQQRVERRPGLFPRRALLRIRRQRVVVLELSERIDGAGAALVVAAIDRPCGGTAASRSRRSRHGLILLDLGQKCPFLAASGSSSRWRRGHAILEWAHAHRDTAPCWRGRATPTTW